MFLISKIKSENLIEITEDDFLIKEEPNNPEKINTDVEDNLKLSSEVMSEDKNVEEEDVKDVEKDVEEDVEEDDEEDDEENENLEDDVDYEDINNLYIISINNVPYFYESDFKIARDKMLFMARQLNYKNNLDFNDSYIRENYEHPSRTNNISVVRRYSLFFFTYDCVLHDLKIDIVKPYNINF